MASRTLACALLLLSPLRQFASAAHLAVRPQDEGWVGADNPGVDSIFAQVNSPTHPGCAIEIVRNGRTLYSRGYGMANLRTGQPITPGTVYDIASLSKQFTAFIIMSLVEQGRLRLDDDVHKYLPELPGYPRPVTIRHLLTHTSGLRDYLQLFPLEGVQFEAVVTPGDALAMLVRQHGVNFSAGEEFEYSNSNYFLLSQVAERIIGHSLATLLNERVFGPLEMSHSTLLVRHGQIIPGAAESYTPTGPGQFDRADYGWETLGDGAIHTTLDDLARWDENFYTAKVGTVAMLRQMEQPATLNDGSRTRYGFGLGVSQYKGLPIITHSGGSVGFVSNVTRFPQQHFSVITACGSRDFIPFNVYQRIADRYLATEIAAASPPAARSTPARLSSPTLHGYAGRYFSEQTGLTRDVVATDSSLKINTLGGGLRPFTAEDSASFRAQGIPVTVRFLPRPGRKWQLDESVYTSQPTHFFRVADSVQRSPAQLEEFVGRYRSAEIDADWRVLRAGRELILRRNGLGIVDDTLHQDFRDGYSSSVAPIRFIRNAAGRVTGMQVWEPAVRALTLRRDVAGAR